MGAKGKWRAALRLGAKPFKRTIEMAETETASRGKACVGEDKFVFRCADFEMMAKYQLAGDKGMKLDTDLEAI